MRRRATSNCEELQGIRVLYSLPCTCGKVYIRQTGRHVSTRLRGRKNDLEHSQDILQTSTKLGYWLGNRYLVLLTWT